MIGNITFHEPAGSGRTVSLFGLAVAVPVMFSLPSPQLDRRAVVSVTPRMQSPWMIVRERLLDFSVSITGLIVGACRIMHRAVRRCFCIGSFRRQMIMRLSFAGWRL